MIIAISIMVFMNIVSLIYIGIVIFEIRDKTNNVYPELMKIIGEQNKVLQGNLDALNRWSDLSSDIIAHIERVEDMEGDIKDIFEWIHSVDNNVADMRRDIQDTDTKLISLMAAYDRNALMFFNDIQSLKKDIKDVNEKLVTIEPIDFDKVYGKSNVVATPCYLKMNDQKGEDEDDSNRAE